MSAADEVVTQRVASRGLLRRFGRPRSWQLFALPHFVVGYVFLIIAADLGLTGWGIAVTPVRAADAALFAALLACGAVCIEATRRLGQPTGVSRDLLSAWWLPIALLLPPVYSLVAPIRWCPAVSADTPDPALPAAVQLGGARAGGRGGVGDVPAPGAARGGGPSRCRGCPTPGPRLVHAAFRDPGRPRQRGPVQRVNTGWWRSRRTRPSRRRAGPMCSGTTKA